MYFDFFLFLSFKISLVENIFVKGHILDLSIQDVGLQCLWMVNLQPEET